MTIDVSGGNPIPAAGLAYDGGAGNDTLVGPNTANVWNITGANAGNTTGFLSSFLGVENLTGGSSTDSFVFVTGGSVSGAINGGGGTDTLDYSAITSQVAVNLGLGSTGLAASLDGTQEVPIRATTATGTADDHQLQRIDQDVRYCHHRQQPGPAERYGVPHPPRAVRRQRADHHRLHGRGARCVPSGTGFTFNATGLSIATSLLGGPANEAAFLGGNHLRQYPHADLPRRRDPRPGLHQRQCESAFRHGHRHRRRQQHRKCHRRHGERWPDRQLRGQHAVGQAGDDMLVGGPGADTMDGGAANDILVWSNGDGSDIMDGGANTARATGSTSTARPQPMTSSRSMPTQAAASISPASAPGRSVWTSARPKS